MIQIRQNHMLNISYNISPRLNEYLKKIEDIRKQILLTPIPKSLELRLRWEATLRRIHYSLKLADNPIEKKDMLRLLSQASHRKLTDDQRSVLRYKQALDYIAQNWQGLPHAVDANEIIELHRIISSGKLRVPKAGLQYLLDYLQARSPEIRSSDGQTAKESPILLAAIINIEMERMQLFTQDNIQISHLAADLFLCKYGYDFKGFLAYEAAWMEDEKLFKDNHERALTSPSLTLWLEYFAQRILHQLEEVFLSIGKSKLMNPDTKESFCQLNERQKSILNFLYSPQEAITNRQIQKKCKTSQITASRDLVKLTNLGCLISHGKGRSVYYTRA